MKKILICGEDATVKATTKLLLRSSGYQVESRNHCKDIFDMIPEFKPDIILIELSISEVNGKIAQEIRSDKRTAHIPVIILGDESDMKHLSPDKEVAFISKPFIPEDLVELIKKKIK